MNAKTFYKILALSLGLGLIIGGFCLFGQSLDNKILILDIIVSILVYIQLSQFVIYPLIDMNRAAHKEVGMMGIYFYVLGTYCFLAIGLMFFGIVYTIPFQFQLMGQLFLVFLALLGRVATLHAGEKVEQIHEKERKMVETRRVLRTEMDNFMDELSSWESPEGFGVQKLYDIQEELKFLSPSANAEAKQYERDFCQIIEELKVLMRNADLNKERIKGKIDQLERILSKRKSINS